MATPTIPADMYTMARRGYACIRLLPSVDVTLCGRLGDRAPEFSDSTSPRFVRHHCAACEAIQATR